MDVVVVLRAAGGAARGASLLAAGVSRTSLASAVVARDVLRPAPGLYALPGCAPEHLARAAVGGALSCLDAARAHGLGVLRPTTGVHLVAARGSKRSWPGAVVHREGLPATPVLDLVATLRSVARCAPRPVAVAVVDEAVRTGRCSHEQLVSTARPGDRAWRQVLVDADARAMSGIESFARVELVEALRGLRVAVEVQVHLRGVGWVDLLVGGWLVVELDGFTYHADRASYREDRRRDQVLTTHGYVWLRFTFEDAVASDGRLADRVLATLLRGRPPRFTSLRSGRTLPASRNAAAPLDTPARHA